MVKGKIVLVAFPFDDLTSTKARPALCLTEPLGPHDHVVLAFISSKGSGNRESTDILIEKDSKGFNATGLKDTSVLKLHRLMTVAGKIIKREIGILPARLQQEVKDKLNKLFDI